MARMVRQRSIGPVYTGWLCGYRTRLYAIRGDEDAGYGRFAHGSDVFGRIDVGVDGPWVDVCATLLHEVIELCFDNNGLSYDAPRSHHRKTYANRFFAFNHQQFDEATAQAGDFIAFAMPELYRVWKKSQKKRILKK